MQGSRVQKKSENVAHLQDRIKLKNLKNSGHVGIRLRQEVSNNRNEDN